MRRRAVRRPPAGARGRSRCGVAPFGDVGSLQQLFGCGSDRAEERGFACGLEAFGWVADGEGGDGSSGGVAEGDGDAI